MAQHSLKALTDTPATIAASATETYIELEESREYAVGHTGLNVAGTAQTDTVYLSKAGTITATMAEGLDKFALKSGWITTVGPGWKKLFFKTAANAPVMAIMPGPHAFGKY